MNVYIAGRSDPLGIIRWRALAALVLAAGHRITHDWTIDIETERAKGMFDHQLSHEERRMYATRDFRAVIDADVFIYQAPHEKSEGSAYEMGMHHAKRDLIKSLMTVVPMLEAMLPISSIVIGDAQCIFASLSDHHVRTDEEAVALLAEIAKSDRSHELIAVHALSRTIG